MVNPNNPYGEPLPSLPAIPAPGPPPPRRDPVRPWLIAALVVFLLAAIALAAVLLWPGDDEKSAGGTSGESASAAASVSDPSASPSAGDQFTAAPNPTPSSEVPPAESSTVEPPAAEPSGPGSTPPQTTNGISEQQRVAACKRAADGEGNRVSSDPQWGTDSGAPVEALTTLLAYLGYDITPTGQYTAGVEQVAKDFQGDFGLEADGIVGPKTWETLHQAACG